MCKRTTLAAFIALASAGGGAVWALASCGNPGAVVADDAGVAADAPVDAKPKPKDAGNDAPVYGELGCTEQPGWIQVHPFRPECTMQMAPPSKWAEAAFPMAACPNGQPKCTQIVLPTVPGRNRSYGITPADYESLGFYLQNEADLKERDCRRGMQVQPTPTGYAIAGVVEMNLNSACRGIPENGNGGVLLNGGITESPRFPAHAAYLEWGSTELKVDTPLRNEFANLFRSQSTIFSVDYSLGSIDVVDIPSNTLLRSIGIPKGVRQWFPEFAAAGDLWGLATYGILGKGELWRTDALGNHNVILQKAGVHMFAPRTDGITMFWIEASGNEVALLDQPKIEIWAGPFSKDVAVTRAGARRLLDVSGVRNALRSVARNGYYFVNLGQSEFVVIRGRDGAYQRVQLLGGWVYTTPAYVDERFVWFNHASLDPTQQGVARIELEPWPP